MSLAGKSFAPIVLFVYNRPDHVRQTVLALQENDLARESELFIYSDGPQDDACSRAQVADVRNFIKTITGFKKNTIIEHEQNRGLADSVIQGVTDIVNRYGNVIVLEDDLVVAPFFLRFMNKALDAYEEVPQVMQISGHMFDVKIAAETDAVFLPFITSWGWATWKRAWDNFDSSMSGYEKIKKNNKLKSQFNLEESYNYFNMLERQLHGKINSWAIRWYLNVFLKNGFTLFPVRSLVHNIGFDGSGTHCGGGARAREKSLFFALKRNDFRFPEVCIDQKAYSVIKLFLSSGGTLSCKRESILRCKIFPKRRSKFFRS